MQVFCPARDQRADLAAVQELLRSEPLALGAAAATGSLAARKERDLGGGVYLPAFNACFDA